MGSALMADTLLCAIGRVDTAMCMNHRYRFTTWRWGKMVAAMVVAEWVVKLAASV